MSRNRLFVLIGLIGFAFALAIYPDTKAHFTPPELPEIQQEAGLPVPSVGPRDVGFQPFEQPFLFQLGSTDKLTGLEREARLQKEYRKILGRLHGEIPSVEVESVNGMTVVAIDGQPFATVLPSDAPDYYQRLDEERQTKVERLIATRWARQLLSDLAIQSYHRHPEVLASYPYKALCFFFVSLALHGLIDVFSRRYLRSPGWSLKAFVWMSALAAIGISHPHLESLAKALVKGGLLPVFYFLLIVTSCRILHRLGCAMLDRYAESYIREMGSTPRVRQRVDTMGEGGRFLVATVVVVIGVMWFLGALGIDIGKLFAGAGIVGVALGVVGKDILVDYFAGVNILADDVFSIGDFIESPVASGTVESFNLRTTRIRGVDGSLAMVTNGQLTLVKNHSREFANADFRIGIAYGSDPDRCLEWVLDEIRLYAEEQPGKLEPEPVFSGVHELADSAVILRALVRTAALAQWEVGRELNRRVFYRFGQEGVEIPFPQRTVWLNQASDSGQGNPPQ